MAWDYQFVDSIASTPGVRLDLQTDWFVREETSFGMPELRRSVVQSALVDGETYPSGAYGNREVVLVLEHRTPSLPDAVSASLQTLTRELNRPANILMYRPGTTQPVFFRTFRSGPSSMQWDASRKVATVEIPAEPFALGLRETLAQATVSNDSAAVTNPLRFDLATIKGDVETPLYLSVPQGDVAATGRRQSVIAVRRGGTPSGMPGSLQAEAMTVGVDTTVQANSPLMSGSGSNYTRTTFAGSTSLTTRLSAGTFPASPGVDVRGTYRVFARVRKTVSADVITMRMTAFLDGAAVDGDIVTLPTGTDIRWVDLGLLSYPLGYDPVTDGMSGVPLAVRGVSLYIAAGRSLGSGSLDIDAITLVPADDRYCEVRWPEFSGPTSYVVDSAASGVYGVGASGELRPTQIIEFEGLAPMASPGQACRVVWLLDVGTTPNGGDDVTRTTRVTPYYWPRYLTVRPVGS